MKFSIVTPSFNQPELLKLCLASTADQDGVSVEHIVQDCCSDFSTKELASQFTNAKFYREKDDGMYDAVNMGLKRASGEVLAYLNCDEQYLPGALSTVKDYFTANPAVDMVFGDVVVTDPTGKYVCSRRTLTPLKYHTWVCHLATLSCAMFFRKSLLDRCQIFFDPELKAVGDAAWILQLMRRNTPMGILRRYTSVFTDTGENLGTNSFAVQEHKDLCSSAPAWTRITTPFFVLHHRLRRLAHGLYHENPFSYQVFTHDHPASRTLVQVNKPTFIWPGRIFRT